MEAALEEAFLADRGFEVPTIAFTLAELRAIGAAADEVAEELGDPVSAALRHAAQGRAREGRLPDRRPWSTTASWPGCDGRAVHLVLAKPYNEAKLSNARIEKALGVATTRNVTVIRALVTKWC